MKGGNSTTENVGSAKRNIYVKMRRWHNIFFVIGLLALISWGITRIVLAYQSSETQALVTPYFYLTGWCIWGVTGIYLVFTFLSAFAAIKASTEKVHTTVAWMTYLVFIAGIAYFFTAFRISAIGMHGLMTGLSNSSDKAAYLLVKFYPYFPLTPVNLASSGMDNPSRYIEMVTSLPNVSVPYIILLGISFLSLILCKKKRFLVILVFLFAAAGIGLNYLIETGFRDISFTLDRDFVRAAPVINYCFSCLSTLMAGLIFYRTVHFRRVTDREQVNVFTPLPLGAFWILVIFMVLAPSLGDLENVHSLERNGRAIIETNR